ncbi:ribosome maturation factor RimP [Desulforhopalus singaporensis]|uniref:Ribosome maturation factor RimP n=1 Tax=Desulforhopalus singaporensis TaxID=91360 RepID=A0A1H0J8Q1_9BACT|nr:ribosome maturation factor RimP [Desulforhopalus singaporensis]SDO40145.1 ribosome maturation factor RimP [Desulforhopalus singaporensis]
MASFLRLSNASGRQGRCVLVSIMSELIIEKITDYLNELLPSMGLELFDVQFRREGHGWVLRVFIDRDGGVTLDHCSDVSREVGQYLDVEDIIDHAYNLEISSPGLERPLRSVDDFARFKGDKAKVRLHEAIDGEKSFVGLIKTVENSTIVLELESGAPLEFTFEMINKARLVF